MYLSEVKIKNFRGYGENLNRSDHFFVFDELDNPLVLFHGFNGHGKTSFFEAIEWCLTDTVARLEKLYKANFGGAYSANDLNRSHYFKFSPSISNQRRSSITDREVVVELLFNNGTKVIRKSNSRVLAISDRSNYTSELEFIEKDKVIRRIDNQELLEYLVPRSNDRSSFIQAHVLAQEGITDFVRKTSPEERKSLFMRYLRQEELSNHIAQLRFYLNGGNVLGKRRSSYEGKKTELISKQRQINEFLRNIGYSSFESYKSQFHLLYEKLVPFIKRKSRLSNIPLDLIIHELEFQSKDYSRLLRGAAQLYENTNAERNKFQKRHTELQVIKNHINALESLQEAEEWVRKGEHTQSLESLNIRDIQLINEDIKKQRSHIDLTKQEIVNRLSKTVESKQLFESFLSYIDNINKTISSELWSVIYEDFQRFQIFKEEFDGIIGQHKASIPLKDETQLKGWQKRYLELSHERQHLVKEMGQIIEHKDSLSLLNSQYQQVLNQVKAYIHDHSNSVTSCPVCLNEDFTSMRYTKEFQLDPEISISSKLITIIDKTVSNGDEKLDELINKEKYINTELAKIVDFINKEVIEPLQSWMKSLREQFILCYDEVKNKLEHQHKELRTSENYLIQREKEISEMWEQMKVSSRVLFGESIELEDISLENLNQVALNKKRWFEENFKKIGFEYVPSLQEISSKMLKIRSEKEVADYYPNNKDQLYKNQLSNIRTFLMLELLINHLEEFLKLKVPGEYDAFFSRYEQLDSEINEVEEKIKYIVRNKTEVKTKYAELVAKQNHILGDQLHGHPVISWVYGAINPHTQYKDLKVIVNTNGTHFTSEEIQGDLYLDQIFSQAQLNILALSTFLGIGLTQKYSSLDQLFLDDPIQSMDDVNVLAFIDVLRAILDSESNNKRLIISTHDDSFAELLAIKMRNKNVVQYRIEGYGPEGPIVEKNK
ncbi:AAA family ATPase [Paenibacillus sp. Mc5Re-14]|uniref:AAA family ATPase n=1 Tax=Paenibacillus sp. Mc5Re-14 TaxID=1030529 RepID=UPI000B25940A|nr:AAA family ATPase [Paenibacillus sp. Mc5Re-14]